MGSKPSKEILIANLQLAVDDIFSRANEDAEREYEYYIISSKKFQNAINKAEIRLGFVGIKGRLKIPDEEAVSWAIKKLNGDKPKTSITQKKCKQQFYEVVDIAVKEAGLPAKWREYVAIYLVKKMPPKIFVFPALRYVTVQDVNTDSVTVSFRKGIRHEEYIKAWLTLSNFLGKGRRKLKAPDEQTRIRDLQMYGKRETYGSTQKKLAQEYVNTDIEYAKDTVKKALKRQKKLFDEGTDLAK